MPAVVHEGDALAVLSTLPAESVHCVVTSPPYWGLRDYGHAGQLGLEPTPAAYVESMVAVFREVRRVLRDDGTLWLNLGDSYAGSGPSGASYQSETTKAREGVKRDGVFAVSATLAARGLTYAEKKPVPPPGLKAKDLVGIPWRVAFALQADGWYLRSDIIWAKPNPMPESVTDRPTKAHEYLFLLSKSERYHYDADAIKEDTVYPELAGLPTSAKWGGKKAIGRALDREATGNEGTNAVYVGVEKRNKRSVWSVATEPFPGAHFAVMPTALVRPCVLAGCPTGGTVLDPFAGSGTVGVVALENGCDFVGVELNPAYVAMARRRLAETTPATLLVEPRIAAASAQGRLAFGGSA